MGNKKVPSNRTVLNCLKKENCDVFAYDSGGQQTIYTIKITDQASDLCGFGFDPRPESSHDLLAQATSGELADDYAATL